MRPLRALCRVVLWSSLLAACSVDDKADDMLEQSDSAVSAEPTTDAGVDARAPMDAFVGTPDAKPVETPLAPDASSSTETPTAPDAGPGLDAGSHPLAGKYVVRTMSYARQKATAAGIPLDFVAKGVLLSVADISSTGLVNEQLCFIELITPQGPFSWIPPAGAQRIPGSSVPLTLEGDKYVRSGAADKTLVSWSADKQPADCVTGAMSATGNCRCYAPDTLPHAPDDCRVDDLDQDGEPGLKLAVSFERPLDLSMSQEAITAQIAGSKSVEWQLPKQGGDKVVGAVVGSVEQNQLSLDGELASQISPVRSASCPSELGQVELVRSDLDCAMLLAGRAADLDSYGVFDVSLDKEAPPPDACPDPDCAVDSDGDGKSDCEDTCPLDPTRSVPGACGCGVAETDTDNDAVPDCLDGCVSDPAKQAPGVCGCGVADVDTDSDGALDCMDACPGDPAKVAPGACGCGVADVDSDSDGTDDCSDACPSDPAKNAPGVCGCGIADSDSDNDALLDCQEDCDADPAKTAPGVCGCGIADADLNGDGTIDCSDACPNDPAKVAPGVCGCGVADTNSDGDTALDCNDGCVNDGAKVTPGACGCGVADTDSDRDGQPDCLDQCPSNPSKTTPETCGCGAAESVCNNPLLGTYALRALLHVRQRIGTGAVTTSRAISYGLVTISDAGSGAVSISEQSCWAATNPNPNEAGGTMVYSWSKPAWVQAMPPTLRAASVNPDGTWSALGTAADIGWDASRQPASCTASATPASGWNPAWGATCTCNASAQPPYDRNGAPYDCRLIDPDGDDQPGISAYVSTSPPSSPNQDATGLSARAFAAGRSLSNWTLTPRADRKHTGTIHDLSQNNVVGCAGVACAGLSSTSPATLACPEPLNPLQLVPVTSSSDSCAEILAQGDALFDLSTDPAWASVAACPNP